MFSFLKDFGQTIVHFLPPSPVNLNGGMSRRLLRQLPEHADTLIFVFFEVKVVKFCEADELQIIVQSSPIITSLITYLIWRDALGYHLAELNAHLDPLAQRLNYLPDGSLLRTRYFTWGESLQHVFHGVLGEAFVGAPLGKYRPSNARFDDGLLVDGFVIFRLAARLARAA